MSLSQYGIVPNPQTQDFKLMCQTLGAGDPSVQGNKEIRGQDLSVAGEVLYRKNKKRLFSNPEARETHRKFGKELFIESLLKLLTDRKLPVDKELVEDLINHVMAKNRENIPLLVKGALCVTDVGTVLEKFTVIGNPAIIEVAGEKHLRWPDREG